MEIFISWSKPRSRALAEALNGWLPEVIQQVKPWLSTEDITKGQRWSAEVSARLAAGSQGIICVTPENFETPWLNFEAGALAKSLTEARVRPVLLDMAPTDVTGPLAQFQATVVHDREDMFRFVRSLNEGCATPLDEARLQKAFDRTWLDFQDAIMAIPESAEDLIEPKGRDSEDMLREILERVRELQRVPSEVRFDVILVSPGGKLIETIKAVREVTGFGLKEAKDLVEAAPSKVISTFDREQAQGTVVRLRAGGAEAQIVVATAGSD
jgi:ribosomal protein L7/L12